MSFYVMKSSNYVKKQTLWHYIYCNFIFGGSLVTLVVGFGFVGGLSSHLNHLIPYPLGILNWQFGTLPIGMFLSNLDRRHLMTSPRILFGQYDGTIFWGCDTFKGVLHAIGKKLHFLTHL